MSVPLGRSKKPLAEKMGLPLVIAFALLLAGLRWLFPERPLDYAGPRALADACFALGLWALILLLAMALGRRVLHGLRVEGLSRLERLVFGLPIGLGILAHGVMALGLAGLLRPWTIGLWLALVAIAIGIAARIRAEYVSCLPKPAAKLLLAWKAWSNGEKAIALIGGILALVCLVLALTPPWDYDGLMYHLQGTRLFLQAGRLMLLPDLWQANGPATVEMLFAIGMAFGSDTFAKLIHVSYAILLVLATFGFGRRYLGRTEGWVAAGILMGIPIWPIWAGSAYVDMAWALYEFLGWYALMRWAETGQRRWSAMAGVLMGLAMGSKYLALGGAAVLGLWLVWRGRRRGLRFVLGHALLYGGVAVLVAAPWYVKNLLWAGNPLYPLVFGGPAWDRERLELLMTYLQGFNSGRGFLDYVLLPWNLYVHHERFATFQGSIEIASPLFLAGAWYGFTRRQRNMDALLVLVLLRGAIWALGSQQVRFLLPVFPGLSLLAGAVLLDLARRPRCQRWGGSVVAGLVGGMLTVTLVYAGLLFAQLKPLAPILGMQSKDAFLAHTIGQYPAIRFIRAALPAEARVLILWDGQGYYCDPRCVPDTEPSRWVQWTSVGADASAIEARLREMGITHILFSMEGADFWLQRDGDGRQRRAVEFFLREFQPAHLQEVYQDQWSRLYALNPTL